MKLLHSLPCRASSPHAEGRVLLGRRPELAQLSGMLTETTGCAVAQRAAHEHDLTQRIVGAFFAKPSWRPAFTGRCQAHPLVVQPLRDMVVGRGPLDAELGWG